ncbi:uncharacterized protein [Parasteatoda tepidariorum]|uniref:uncharacterized protein n=1 Tax=Parasteatoda tepidariorum TaxID=114398 RepID=UPI00077FC879|nr:uncharacterized protein LOC107451560 [Parasteatoda tepidariorum]
MMSSVSGHYGLFEAIRYKRHRQAMLLAEAGIDVDCRNDKGQTPLIYTVVTVDDCSRSRNKLVRLFLEAGADPNAADWKGLTALMHASILGQVETIKALLECTWTNPCCTDSNGNTALMYAAAHGHHEIIAVFLSVFRNDIKSLQLHKRNNDGFTALHLAVRNRYDACARLLTKEGQLFPTAIDEFPDPKDLDRDPTPTELELEADKNTNIISTQSEKILWARPDSKRTTGTMTIEPEDLEFLSNSLSVLECSVGDIPIYNYTHPFGLQTNKYTQVISIGQRKTPEETETKTEQKNMQDLLEDLQISPRIDEWPTVPIQLKPVSHKILQPLLPIEITNSHTSNVNTFQRKCLLKQSHRGTSGLRIKLHDSRNAISTEELDHMIMGSSLKSYHANLRTKQASAKKKDNIANLLPLIPCQENSSLPPVKYSIKRSASSKKNSFFQSTPFIAVRADQTPRDLEIFKKNIEAM